MGIDIPSEHPKVKFRKRSDLTGNRSLCCDKPPLLEIELNHIIPNKLHLIQWNLSITVTSGPTASDFYIQVAVIQKTSVTSNFMNLTFIDSIQRIRKFYKNINDSLDS